MMITFLGTKGGTGTTTMAVNCAAEMRRISGRSTIVVDAKPGPGDVAVFLGLRPRHSLIDFIDQVAWNDPSQARRYVAEHTCGVHVLGAAEGFGRPGVRDAEGVEQVLRCFAFLYDHVVIDAGTTLTAGAISALTMSDLVMLVANPDVPCLRNLQRLSDALKLAGVAPERVQIVLNRTSENGLLLLPQIEQVLGRSIEFQVTSDYRTVAASINTGVPVNCLRTTELQLQVEAIARSLVSTKAVAAAS
jgi:pilus assembly protein CpaE